MSNYLKYAVYLACSWLWCIGAFFPLLLNRDYGWPAVAVFTVFNVAGAAAMGFYFNQQSQQTFFTRHRAAISVFSYVTIIYQLFFVAWLGAVIGLPWLLFASLAFAIVLYCSKSHINLWAIAVYVASAGLFAYFNQMDWPVVEIAAKTNWPHVIAPLALGFIFSPYLDITFHRAFRKSNKPRQSFAIGFGILFLSLLGFVYCYAQSLAEAFFTGSALSVLLYPVVIFITMQTGFTIAAHTSEYSEVHAGDGLKLWWVITGLSVLVWLFMWLWGNQQLSLFSIPVEEMLYKGFLFFYGVVVPLYLIFGQQPRLLAVVLVLMTPFHALGFLVPEFSYLLSVAMVVLALGYVVKKARSSGA